MIAVKTYFSQFVRAFCRVISLFGVCTILLSFASFVQADLPNANNADELVGIDGSYYEYRRKNALTPSGDSNYEINANEFVPTKNEPEVKSEEFMGESGVVILNRESGSLTYEFTVEKSGLYNFASEYFPVVTGSSLEPSMVFMIDNELPFNEAETVYLSKIYANDSDGIRQDKNENDIRPRQTEKPRWLTVDFIDNLGFTANPFEFYIEKGTHTFTIEVTQESIAFRKFTIKGTKKLPSYFEYAESFKDKSSDGNSDKTLSFRAELASEKSHSDIFPETSAGRPNALLEPSDFIHKKLNVISNSRPGSWMSWKVTVEESGFYKFGMNVLQNGNRGIYSGRRLYINGEVPFSEADSIEIPYSNKWNNYVFGGNDPFEFYFEKDAEYILTLECTPGRMSSALSSLKSIEADLSEINRQITMVLGHAPDIYRDYDFNKEIPELFDTIEDVKTRLEAAIETFGKELVGSGSATYIAEDMIRELSDFLKKPRTIPSRMTNFRTAVSSFSSWLRGITYHWVSIDTLYLFQGESVLPKAQSGFFKQLLFSVKEIIASFFNDQNIFNSGSGTKHITVWATTGRDQANLIRDLIDDEFSNERDISVSLSIVSDNTTLLQASLGGKGPDVAMFVDKTLPVNLAARNALHNFSQFEGFNKVLDRFHSSAIIPYKFGDKIYAMPNTQTFNIMFVRTDILTDLGLKTPETWDDLYKSLAVIQRSNMLVGIGGDNEGSNQYNFETFLMQLGGNLYNEDLTATAFESKEALDAFKMLTGFYTEQGLELTYDFFTYFRNGIMPIAIADYSQYNLISAAAPELKGLWTIAPIPGTLMENGDINRAEGVNSSASIIMKNAEDPESAYMFLEWWMREETQTRYCQEMEATIGPAARFSTANRESVSKLSWRQGEFETLISQWDVLSDFPTLPSGYYIRRNLNNAFRNVVHRGGNPRETLNKYARIIDKEIVRKNEEINNQ